MTRWGGSRVFRGPPHLVRWFGVAQPPVLACSHDRHVSFTGVKHTDVILSSQDRTVAGPPVVQHLLRGLRPGGEETR